MKRLNRYKNVGKNIYTCPKCDNDTVVREGLAYSPADMARLTERGMPVNSINNGKVFIDGEENPTFTVTDDRCRHIDVCDLWERHMVLRDKARAAAKAKKLNSKS